ncbi:hypothetical protein [Streptomyces sp. NPDC096323]|uniref:hypothetical protein n=1 Tax=Streptomyces sp. NPDC096323 TaxID=3155822 RepID=UPI0033313511
MTDRINLAISAAGVPIALVLLTGAVRAYEDGEGSGWFVAGAALLQAATVLQLAQDLRRRRRSRARAG